MKVSIIVTSYNEEKYVEQCVRSAAEQTFPDKEVVVVDDNSNDATSAILDGLKAEYPDVVYVVHSPKNVGQGIGRRIGLEYSDGDYVMFLDGDDYLKPKFVENLMNGANGADIVAGGLTEFVEDGNRTTVSYVNRAVEGVDRMYTYYKERNTFMNNKLIRRKLYSETPPLLRQTLSCKSAYIHIPALPCQSCAVC